jgi:hypothetical protein
MSLLATYASDYNNLNDIKNIENKRKNTRNKTLKKKPNIKDNAKMEAMFNAMNDDDEDELNNFEPIQPPSISKIQQHNDHKKAQEDTIENFSDLPTEYAKQYYQQFVPYVNPENEKKNDLNVTSQQLLNGIKKPSADSDLQTKLDYLIYLLESQNEQKTDNVLEELILYSFLGIFTIFIVDSFAKVGKYIR